MSINMTIYAEDADDLMQQLRVLAGMESVRRTKPEPARSGSALREAKPEIDVTTTLKEYGQTAAMPAAKSVGTPTPAGDADGTATSVVSAPTVTATVAPETAVTVASGAPGPLDYQTHVAPTMSRLLAVKGAVVVKELLAEYGVKKGGELPVEVLNEVLVKAKGMLGE